MNALDTRKAIQQLLGTTQDGRIGHNDMAALNLLNAAPDASEWPPAVTADVHAVIGSSFADPADVRSFRACKAEGKTDQECFRVGDNGIGKWGDDCSEGSGPAVALPPEDWQGLPEAHNKPVLVTNPTNRQSVIAKLKDTMPKKEHITNGAGIDMNPDTCAALGLTPPVMHAVTWEWV